MALPQQQLEKLIGRRIETELMILYAKKQFPDSKHHKGFVTRVLKDAYHSQAGIDQKDYVTRRKFAKLAADGFYAEVFDFSKWNNKDLQVIGAEMLAIIQAAAVVTAGDDAEGAIFESKLGSGGFNFLHLTDAGEALVKRMDLKAESLAFIDLPMVHSLDHMALARAVVI